MLINPKDIVERELGLAPGMKVADFGCGSGHFTTEIAKQIGRDGMVYAFDVQEEALSAVKSRASAMDIDNIETARINLEIEKSTALTGGLVDLVIISNMLFQVENKEAVAREAFRILKLGGKVMVIEWDVSSALAGPPREVRINKKDMIDLFEGEKLEFAKEFPAGESHYGLIFSKNKHE